MGRVRIGRGGVELLLTLLALAWLASLGRGLGGAEWLANADGRYQRDGELRLETLAEARRADWLLLVCGQFHTWLSGRDGKLCDEYRKPTGWARWRAMRPGASAAVQPSAQPMDADTRARLGEVLTQMQTAHAAWARSFYQPMETIERERDAWRVKAQEGFVDDDEQTESEQWKQKTQAYREAYRLNLRHGSAYSRPFECAFAFLSRQAVQSGGDVNAVKTKNPANIQPESHVGAVFNRERSDTQSRLKTAPTVNSTALPDGEGLNSTALRDDAGAVLALVGLAAVLDGNRKALPEGAFSSGQDWNATEKADRCQDSVQPKGQTSPLEAAQAAATTLHQAHASQSNAAKAEATLAMFPKLWRYLLVWSLTGLAVLHLGRSKTAKNLDLDRPYGRVRNPPLPFSPMGDGTVAHHSAIMQHPSRLLAVSLLLWALAYALTRPHLEWLGSLLGGWWPVAWLVGSAVLLWSVRMKPIDNPVNIASRCAYPGFVLFVGLGWMLLADLSTHAYPENRFQALYQQAYVFLAFMLASVLPILSVPLARLGLSLWTLLPLLAAGRIRRTLIGWGFGLVLAVGLLVFIKVFFSGHRQNTSEIFRFMLLSGLAWFLLARAEALASTSLSLEQNKAWWKKSLLTLRLTLLGLRVKLALPLLILLGFVAMGLVWTDDFGPLLVVLYGGALFFGLLVARWQAGLWGEAPGLGLGMLAIAGYVWSVTYLLLQFGGQVSVRVGERLESALHPFLASNDQIAHILWFQEAALDNGGFGLGFSPWCGEASGACLGVPPQIQSDYIVTALIGVFGNASWVLLALFVFWLWRLARSHPAATSGKVESAGLDQAWLSWMTLCWVGLSLVQMAVTVAGNRGWLPLTGITFPFLSYGAWSLLGNALFLGLSLHLHRRH